MKLINKKEWYLVYKAMAHYRDYLFFKEDKDEKEQELEAAFTVVFAKVASHCKGGC
jgi:hypothetical protein